MSNQCFFDLKFVEFYFRERHSFIKNLILITSLATSNSPYQYEQVMKWILINKFNVYNYLLTFKDTRMVLASEKFEQDDLKTLYKSVRFHFIMVKT